MSSVCGWQPADFDEPLSREVVWGTRAKQSLPDIRGPGSTLSDEWASILFTLWKLGEKKNMANCSESSV